MAKSPTLLTRLLNTPDLPAVVPRLPATVLHRVIETCGLEDCSEVVALATSAQLAAVFDLDLWRAPIAGGDERFDADRFGVWLSVLLDAGPEVAAEKIAGLDLDLVAAGFAQHIVVFYSVAATAYTTLDGEHMQAPMSGRTIAAEIGGYAIETRRTSAWDAIRDLLVFLATDRGEYFHRLMGRCVSLSNGGREEDASNNLPDDAEQHLFDVAGERQTRRERQGYVASAEARAFLRGARDLPLDGTRPEPSAAARAYFRAFQPPLPGVDPPHDPGQDAAPVETVLAVLRDAGVLAAPPRALLEAGGGGQSRLAWIESHVASRPESGDELAYLANVIVAGCSVQGRAFAEREAGDLVIATCNLGLENWPSHWTDRDLITAFQVGWTVLQRDVCLYASRHLLHALGEVVSGDRDTIVALARLRRDLVRHIAGGEPWRARGSFDVILTLDAQAWAALLGAIDECPVLHAALDRSRQRPLTIDPAEFQFIAGNADVAVVRRFMANVTAMLNG